MNIQFQIGGSGNKQIIKETIESSLGRLLNNAEKKLQERTFVGADVKERYCSLLNQLSAWVYENREHALAATVFIKFPFVTLPEEETFQDSYFLEALLDALSIIAFSNLECVVELHHLNIRLNKEQRFGIYYQQGLSKLVDSFQRVLKSLKMKGAILPAGFVIMVLNSIEKELDPSKMPNLVTDIFGDDPFIKPFQAVPPRCIGLSSYIIEHCESVDAASAHVKEVLDVH